MAQFRIRLSEPIYPLGQDLTIEADNAQDALAQANQSAARFGVSVTGLQPLDAQGNPLPAGDGPLGRGSFSYNIFSELPNLDPGLSEQQRLERERLEQERLEQEKLESISNDLEPPDPTPPTGNEDVFSGATVPGMGGFFSSSAPTLEQTFYDPSNYQQFGRFFERRLVREENRNGAVYRFYEYNQVGDRGDVVFDGYVLVAPGQDNVYRNPFSVEYHVTDEAFNNNKNWNTLEPTDLEFTSEQAGTLNEVMFRNLIQKSRGPMPEIFESVGRDFEQTGKTDGSMPLNFFTGREVFNENLEFDFGEPTDTPLDTQVENIEGQIPQGDFTPGLPTNNVVVEDLDSSFLDFEPTEALTNFLASSPTLGLSLPLDQEGNPRNITPQDFPGFPPEILDPNNLFVRVTDQERVLADPTKPFNAVTNPYETTTVTRTVPNPAVELLLAQYAQQIQAITDLQGSADDILQAQVSASGGLVGGPAGTLDINQLEDLERSTRSIQASGGRLVQEAVLDEEGNRTGQFRERLTPLGTEEVAARQQRLQEEALRQSGGLLGGFFSPLDESGQPLEAGQQRFVQGFTPQQLLQRQEQEAQRQRQAELELVRAQQAPQTFRNIADIYSNPAQLAAIVASGGSPLLRGQIPTSPFAPQNNVQLAPSNIIGYADGQPIFRPGTTPVTPSTTNQTQINQNMLPSSPINIDVSALNEQQLSNLNPLGLATLQGAAAAGGTSPSDLEDIAAGNTPGDQLPDNFGVFTPRTLRY